MVTEQSEESETRKGQTLAGFAVLACIVILAVSVLAAFVAWGDNDWTGGGTCLIAAAISAGLLLNAMVRR